MLSAPERGFAVHAKTLSAALAALFLSRTALAHHSVSSWFDTRELAELEGRVTELKWQNPHVRFTLAVPEPGGATVEWDIETLSLSGISRWGITEGLVEVGAELRVAGNPSKRSLNNLFVRNILLPSGEEIVLGGQPRWSEQTRRAGEMLASAEGDTSEPESGIFRPWSSGSGSFLFPENINADFDFSVYPLTVAAGATLAAFDHVADDPTNDCAPKGMPTIMEQPYPLAFVDNGDHILVRLEEYDTRRIIHLSGAEDPANVAPSLLGYSVGRSEGMTLVVTTARVDWGHFDTVGIRLSGDAVMVERFTPTALGDRLDYELTVSDPATFTAPVELRSHWIYRPEIELGAYRCLPV